MATDNLSVGKFLDILTTNIKDVYDNDIFNKTFDSLRVLELTSLLQQKLGYNAETAEKLAKGVINEGKFIDTDEEEEDDDLQDEIEDIRNKKTHHYSILGFGAPTTCNEKRRNNPISFENDSDMRRLCYESFMEILKQKCPQDMEDPFGDYCEITSINQIAQSFEDFLMNPAQGLTGTVLVFFTGHGHKKGFRLEHDEDRADRDHLIKILNEVWETIKAKGQLKATSLQIVFAECQGFNFKIESPGPNVTVSALATESYPNTTKVWDIKNGNITSCSHTELDMMASKMGDEVAGNFDVTSEPTVETLFSGYFSFESS